MRLNRSWSGLWKPFYHERFKNYLQSLKKKMQHLHCLLMICKIVTIGFKPFSMKTWHYKHKKMCIRQSYKNVKTPSPILKHAMFFMREIQAKTTSLYANIQHLKQLLILDKLRSCM